MLKLSKGRKASFEALRYLSVVATALGVSIFAAILAFVLVRGGEALSLDFLFGEYGEKPSLLPAILGTLQLNTRKTPLNRRNSFGFASKRLLRFLPLFTAFSVISSSLSAFRLAVPNGSDGAIPSWGEG